MASKARLSLTPDEVACLLAVLRDGLGEAPGFPEPSERRVRLERWVQRLAERLPRDIDLELRLTPADLDVLVTALGIALKKARAAATGHFERLLEVRRQPGAADPEALTAAQHDLERVERLDALQGRLAQSLGPDAGRGGRRRWILP